MSLSTKQVPHTRLSLVSGIMLTNLLVWGLTIVGISLAASSPWGWWIFVILTFVEGRNLSICVSPVLVHLLVSIVNKLVVVGLSLVIKVVYLWNVGFYWSLSRPFLATWSPLWWLLSFGEGLAGIHSVRHHLRGPSFLIPFGQFCLLSFDLLAIAVEFGVHFLQVVSIFISLIHLSVIKWSSTIKSHDIRHLIIRKTLVLPILLNLTAIVTRWDLTKGLFHIFNNILFLWLHLILGKVFWCLLIVHILLLVTHIKRYSLRWHCRIFNWVWILKGVTSWAATDNLEAVIRKFFGSKLSVSSRVLPWIWAGGESDALALRGPGSSILFLLSRALWISWRSCTLATIMPSRGHWIHRSYWTVPISIKYDEIIVLWHILFEAKVLCAEALKFLAWSIVS